MQRERNVANVKSNLMRQKLMLVKRRGGGGKQMFEATKLLCFRRACNLGGVSQYQWIYLKVKRKDKEQVIGS